MAESPRVIAPTDLARLLAGSHTGGLLIWAGAGLSAPSGLPLGSELRRSLLELALGGSLGTHWSDLPLEAILAAYGQAGVRTYTAAFMGSNPAIGHRFVARFLRDPRNAGVVTTNFDTLFEKALFEDRSSQSVGTSSGAREIVDRPDLRNLLAQAASLSGKLVKIHGSIDRPEALCDTIGRLVSQSVRADVLALLDFAFVTGPHDSVLVMGYSGHDEFDVNPSLHLTKPCTKRVFYLKHLDRSSATEPRSSPSQFSRGDPIFLGLVTDMVEADTSQLLRLAWKAMDWVEPVNIPEPNRVTSPALEACLISLDHELAAEDGLRKGLLAGLLVDAVVTLLGLDESTAPVDDLEFWALSRTLRDGFERAIRVSRRIGKKEVELVAHFDFVRFIQARLSHDPRNEELAVWHARLAQELASEVYGENHPWFIRSSLLCAIVNEGVSHHAEGLIPEYSDIYSRVKNVGVPDEIPLVAYTLARAYCASGNLRAGLDLLTSELNRIRESGNLPVLSATYLVLAEGSFRTGQPELGREYGRRALMLQVVEGVTKSADVDWGLEDWESKVPLAEAFDMALLPDPPFL